MYSRIIALLLVCIVAISGIIAVCLFFPNRIIKTEKLCAVHVDSEVNEDKHSVDTSIEDSEGSATIELSVKTDSQNLKKIYREYFNNNYSDDNKVCLIDITHDGANDMIVFSEDGDLSIGIDIFSVKNGRVVKTAETGIHSWRAGLFLTSNSGTVNFVEETSGISTGAGSVECREFYIDNSGKEIEIKSFDKYLDMGEDYTAFINVWEKEVENHYGKGYKNLWLLDVNEFTHNSSVTLKCNYMKVDSNDYFGINNPVEKQNGNIIDTLVEGDWCGFSWQSPSYQKLVFHRDGTFDVYEIGPDYSQGELTAMAYSIKRGNTYTVDNDGTIHLYYDEFPASYFVNATYDEDEDIIISEWHEDYDEFAEKYCQFRYCFLHFPDGIDDDYAIRNCSDYSCSLLYDEKD